MDSLERLQLDYVDIIYAEKYELNKGSLEEIVRAFDYVIKKGYAFYWGLTKWSANDIMEAYSIARQFNLEPPVVAQVEYNLINRDRFELSIKELNKKFGIGCITLSPLAGGILTSKYEDGIPQHSRASHSSQSKFRRKILSETGRENQVKITKFAKLAGTLGITPAQLAIAWCLRNPECSCVTLGISSIKQLEENLGALKVLNLLDQTYIHQMNMPDINLLNINSGHELRSNSTDLTAKNVVVLGNEILKLLDDIFDNDPWATLLNLRNKLAGTDDYS